MVQEARKITPQQGGELEHLVEEMLADGAPRIIERNGQTVLLALREGDDDTPRQLPPYDRVRVERAIQHGAGLLKGVDVEQLKRDIREARGQDSTGRPGTE